MKGIRIDRDGLPRCWNCGSKGLKKKRTLRAKATGAVAGSAASVTGAGAVATRLLTKKHLKCQRCGKYNATRKQKPYDGPAGRKYKKEWKAEQRLAKEQSTKAKKAEKAKAAPSTPDAPLVAAGVRSGSADLVTKLSELTELHRCGSLTDDEFAEAKAALLDGGC